MTGNILTPKSITIGLFYLGIQLLITGFTGKAFCQPTFQRLYGTMDNDAGASITKCSPGGYLVSGIATNYYFADPEIYLIRITENGDTVWTRTYEHPNKYDENVQVYEQPDNSYLLGNNTENDSTVVLIQKYNDNGEELWGKRYILDAQTYLRSMTGTQDTGIAFCGTYQANWPMWSSVYVIKTDNDGNQLWLYTCQGTYLKNYYATHIERTMDNNLMLCGSVDNPEFEKDMGLLIKINPDGVSEWNKEYAAPEAGRSLYISDCKQLPDSTYILLGGTYDAFMYENKLPMLMKLDKQGNSLWLKQLDLLDKRYSSLTIETTGDFLLLGPENDSAQVIRTNQAGEIVSSITFIKKYTSTLNQIIKSADNGYIMTGTASTNFGFGGTDVLIMKANEYGIITEIPESEVPGEEVKIWPNPCNGFIDVKCRFSVYSLSVFDSRGFCVYTCNKQADLQASIKILTDSFPAGMLFIRCVTNQGVFSSKFIKL